MRFHISKVDSFSRFLEETLARKNRFEFFKSIGAIKIWIRSSLFINIPGSHFEKTNNSSWIKKAVLRGPLGNFKVLNGPDLYNFFRTSPKGPAVRWYTTTLSILYLGR